MLGRLFIQKPCVRDWSQIWEEEFYSDFRRKEMFIVQFPLNGIHIYDIYLKISYYEISQRAGGITWSILGVNTTIKISSIEECSVQGSSRHDYIYAHIELSKSFSLYCKHRPLKLKWNMQAGILSRGQVGKFASFLKHSLLTLEDSKTSFLTSKINGLSSPNWGEGV